MSRKKATDARLRRKMLASRVRRYLAKLNVEARPLPEMHGTFTTRSYARRTSSSTHVPAPGLMSVARDIRWRTVMVRTDTRDLTVDEHYQFVAAFKKGVAAGKKVADVAEDWVVGKNVYARSKKQWKELGDLQNLKKGGLGAKRKVTGAAYEKFSETNRK